MELVQVPVSLSSCLENMERFATHLKSYCMPPLPMHVSGPLLFPRASTEWCRQLTFPLSLSRGSSFNLWCAINTAKWNPGVRPLIYFAYEENEFWSVELGTCTQRCRRAEEGEIRRRCRTVCLHTLCPRFTLTWRWRWRWRWAVTPSTPRPWIEHWPRPGTTGRPRGDEGRGSSPTSTVSDLFLPVTRRSCSQVVLLLACFEFGFASVCQFGEEIRLGFVIVVVFVLPKKKWQD